MTRLVESDIDHISRQIKEYDEKFSQQTGYSMEEIAKIAVGIKDKIIKKKVAVVPVTSGLGIIGGFSFSVAEILRHCGIETIVTEKTDVAGIQEAYQSDSEVIFMADDDICAAFCLDKKIQSDNGYATGIGFAAALHMAAGDLTGEEVLILGAGPVGFAAASYISDVGGTPVIYDLQNEKAQKLADRLPSAKAPKQCNELKEYKYIIDASTSGGFISKDDVSHETIIASPGMPIGVKDEVMDIATVIYNPLELGIMTMYFDCINKLEGSLENE
jgi:pyrrolysine biosynthesis protein PylD